MPTKTDKQEISNTPSSNQQGGGPPILLLPIEILAIIFLFLRSPGDFSAFSLTYKLFYKITRDNQFLKSFTRNLTKSERGKLKRSLVKTGEMQLLKFIGLSPKEITQLDLIYLAVESKQQTALI